MPGNAQFADHEYVEWNAERPRHFSRDGHPAAGQGQHDHIVSTTVADENLAQQFSGLDTIAKRL